MEFLFFDEQQRMEPVQGFGDGFPAIQGGRIVFGERVGGAAQVQVGDFMPIFLILWIAFHSG